MTYWVMKLYDDNIAKRLSLSECGFEPDDDRFDTGFPDYDTAANFAASMASYDGGQYAVVKVADFFTQVPSLKNPGDTNAIDKWDVFRIQQTDDGPVETIGRMIDRCGFDDGN